MSPSASVLSLLEVTPRLGRFGRGYAIDQRDRSKDLTTKALFGAVMREAADASLEQYVDAIYNQLQTETCVGWAFAQGIKERLAVVGTKIGLPSPVGLYTGGRAMARKNAGLTPEQAPLQDTGSQPSLVLAACNNWGVPANEAWPFDPATINQEPTFEELEIASAFKLTGYYSIGSTGSQRVADVRQAISSGFPVIIGTQADQALEDYAGGKGIVTAPNAKNLLGGHMMHIVGYTSDDRLRGVNQWGTAWGDSGLFWADLSWLTSSYVADLFVITAQATGHVGSMVRTSKVADATTETK